MKENRNIDGVIKQLIDYFNKYEAQYYTKALNPATNKSYRYEARRKFIKYYLGFNLKKYSI